MRRYRTVYRAPRFYRLGNHIENRGRNLNIPWLIRLGMRLKGKL